MKVFWSTEALQDREDIWNYIAQDNPIAAAETFYIPPEICWERYTQS